MTAPTSRSPRPIEIIGGGLAGLSLGLALRRAGVPVRIDEAGDYPRHRVCGEFIAGLASTTIERLGLTRVLADALQHRAVAWFVGGKPAPVQQLPSPALGLSRHVLDARLADAFVAAGGELRRRTRCTDLAPAPGRVFAHGRQAGRSPWLGLKFHVRGLELARELELHLGAHAYVGLARIEGGAVNVCGLFRRSRAEPLGVFPPTSYPEGRERRPPAYTILLNYLRASDLGRLADRLAAAQIDGRSFASVAALRFDRNVAARDRISLGDAGAMIPPFTGNGMAMAFQSAELALGPLLAYARGGGDWAQTCRATNAALRGRFRLRLASADALHPFLLRPQRQRWFAALGRARLLPFRSLYAALH